VVRSLGPYGPSSAEDARPMVDSSGVRGLAACGCAAWVVASAPSPPSAVSPDTSTLGQAASHRHVGTGKSTRSAAAGEARPTLRTALQDGARVAHRPDVARPAPPDAAGHSPRKTTSLVQALVNSDENSTEFLRARRAPDRLRSLRRSLRAPDFPHSSLTGPPSEGSKAKARHLQDLRDSD
jgi:hypothetical protein